jgi:hypothetical protein
MAGFYGDTPFHPIVASGLCNILVGFKKRLGVVNMRVPMWFWCRGQQSRSEDLIYLKHSVLLSGVTKASGPGLLLGANSIWCKLPKVKVA